MNFEKLQINHKQVTEIKSGEKIYALKKVLNKM